MTSAERIANELRDSIRSGFYKRGALLPSRRSLAAQFNVAPMTLEHSVKQLEREGLIRSEHGRGTFVENEIDHANRSDVNSRAVGRRTVAVYGQVPEDWSERARYEMTGWSVDVVSGAYAELRKRGMHALTLNALNLDDDALRDISDGAALGVIVPEHGRYRERPEVALKCAKMGIPIVVGGDYAEFADFDRVLSDFEEGAYLLTRFLIERGRKRILQVWQEPATEYWYAGVRKGHLRAMGEAGLTTAPPIVSLSCEHVLAESHQSMTSHFEHSVRVAIGSLFEVFQGADAPDALMVHSDGPARQVAKACRVLGRIPNQDVDIAGYDNYWMSDSLSEIEPTHPIATIEKQISLIGEEMVRLMLDRVQNGRQLEPEIRIIPPKLVITENI